VQEKDAIRKQIVRGPEFSASTWQLFSAEEWLIVNEKFHWQRASFLG
jgi:hypothetical protein